MPPFIPYGRQSIDEDDLAAVLSALGSDWLTCGPQVEAFEREFSERVGARHAVAVSSATAALHLAMRVAEIGPGDRVMTSPITFVASANAAAFVGATPDFVDIDPISTTLDPEALSAGWTDDVRAVVAVDYAGQTADLPAIAAVARSRGAVVIEDACHGVGGSFFHEDQVRSVGGHPWADLTVFSFHPVKTMTTGEGGMLVTDHSEYARRARLLRSHGLERDRERFLGFGDDPLLSEEGPWVYEMHELGYNYRITDIQCALGRTQLRRLNGFIARRREIVARYNQAFGDLPWLRCPRLRRTEDRDLVSWHLYTAEIDFTELGITRTEAMARLRALGVGSQVLYIPVHLQPWYRRTFGYRAGKCPRAEAFYARALSLPLFAAMTDHEVERVVNAVKTLAE